MYNAHLVRRQLIKLCREKGVEVETIPLLSETEFVQYLNAVIAV
jgi:hypothetical protein